MNAFVETTGMIDLIFKDKGVADQARGVLTKYESTYSSQYVRMEMKRGVLQYYVALYNKSIECQTLGEVHAYIHSLSSSLQRHRLSTMLEAIAGFYKGLEAHEHFTGPMTSRQHKTLLESYLRTRILRAWKVFDEAVDVVLDTVECYKHQYTLKPPIQVGSKIDNTLENCDRYKPQICRVRQFINENEAAYVSLRDHLERESPPDKETSNRVRAIKETLRVPKRPVAQRECWRIGDAVIAMEAPDGATIITRNKKHFEPICRLIGKPLESY